MTNTKLVNPPTLVVTGVSTATTYHFSTVPRSYGWVLATVNDETGELSIQSDWGAWAYRWPGQAFPQDAPTPKLSRFLAARTARHGYPDTYLADKLTSDDLGKRERLDPEGTVAHLREVVLAKRRAKDITCEVAREVWDGLGEILTYDDHDTYADFTNRFYDLADIEQVFHESISKYMRTEPVGSYLVLRDCIIPALVAAIGERLAQRAAERSQTAARSDAGDDEIAVLCDARIADLHDRMTRPGPKMAHLSASEVHEVSDFIAAARTQIPLLLARAQKAEAHEAREQPSARGTIDPPRECNAGIAGGCGACELCDPQWWLKLAGRDLATMKP